MCDRATALDCGHPYDNVLVQGIRDDVVVVEEAFFMGHDSVSNIEFGDMFTDLDSFVIWSMRYPDTDPLIFCANSPCASFNIDNVMVELIPLPVPATGLLSATAFVGLVLMRRWRIV